MDTLLSHIPGFRTRTPLHMVLAGVYYLLSILMMCVSIPLGLFLLSGPFLLFSSHAAIGEYERTKQAKALISLFLSAALCGGSLIAFIVDLSARQQRDTTDTAVILETAPPFTTPDPTASPAHSPTAAPSPIPSPQPMEKAVVMGIGIGPCLHVQFEDTSAGEIRFAGIHIDPSIAPQASEYLTQALPPGSIVYIERECDATGCYVWMEGPNHAEEARDKTLNALLVAGGLAAAEPEGKYAAEFAACQEAAQAACLGLWAAALETAAATQPPAEPSPAPTPEPAPSPDPAPPVDADPAPAAEDPPPPPGGVYYCGSKNSDVFHLSTCASASRISGENLVVYPSREDAVHAGKRPCKKCGP